MHNAGAAGAPVVHATMRRWIRVCALVQLVQLVRCIRNASRKHQCNGQCILVMPSPRIRKIFSFLMKPLMMVDHRKNNYAIFAEWSKSPSKSCCNDESMNLLTESDHLNGRFSCVRPLHGRSKFLSNSMWAKCEWQSQFILNHKWLARAFRIEPDSMAKVSNDFEMIDGYKSHCATSRGQTKQNACVIWVVHWRFV